MAAARLLQISRASLYERLAKWPDLESKVQVSGSA
jgi:Bacterial regulatory protein, Fis family